MQPLTGVVKNYAWGSTSAIPALLHRRDDGRPQAEYWLGAHAAGPATMRGLGRTDAPQTLDTWLRLYPEALGEASRARFGDRLPFLLKVLAADKPLSLQAHPQAADAAAGFDRENAAGVPLDAPERNFKDPWPKPELLVALTPFEALSGFRDPKHTLALFEALDVRDTVISPVVGPLRHRDDPQAALAEVFLDTLASGDIRGEAVTEVVAACARHLEDPGALGDFARMAVLLDEHYPGDASLLAALMLNHVRLDPGQALHNTPGTLHAYISGVGVEIMANSDNVLRGGLTPKHIDPSALAACVDFEAKDAPVVHPLLEDDGILSYPTPDPQFALWRLDTRPGHPVPLPGAGRPRILLVVEGTADAHDPVDDLTLTQGQACFIGADESPVLTGSALAFLAASGV
ncbi:MAG: mannose-6-phosphate isomerase, class I [Actinomycetia bacterium]|nr:mannose-6-phosphate isomerase, class I [Actinomycetes bacterium]